MGKRGKHARSRVIRLWRFKYVQHRALKQFVTYRWAHTQTHTQNKWTQSGLYYPFGSEQRRAEGREDSRLPGRTARLDVRTFPEHQSAKKEPGQLDADHASHKTSREPEHASDEMPFAQPREMCLERARTLPLRAPADPHTRTRTRAGEDGRRSFLTRSSRSNQPTLILSSPFLLSLSGAVHSGVDRSGVDRCQARFAQAWLALGRGSHRHGSLSGADRSGEARSPWVGHDLSLTWHAAKQTVVDHIWEWNSVRTNSEHARIPASVRRMPGAEGFRCCSYS